MTAVVGELGESANIIKKINRIRDGVKGNTETEVELKVALGYELADTFIYLDLLAQSLGYSLETMVRAKFNHTSCKIGYQKVMNLSGGLDDCDPEIDYDA